MGQVKSLGMALAMLAFCIGQDAAAQDKASVGMAETSSRPEAAGTDAAAQGRASVGMAETSSRPEAAGTDAAAQGRASIGIGSIEFRAMDSAGNKNRRAYGRNEVQEDTAAFVDMITTALVKTNKFEVVERDRVDAIMAEQSGIAQGGSSVNFDFRGADPIDYILLGAITEYGVNQQSAGAGQFGMASEVARMAVDVRVIDTQDGRIGFADSISAEVRAGTAVASDRFSAADGKSEGDALGQVMRKAAQGVVNLIVSNVFPIRVVSVSSEGIAMLNYGSSMLREGDLLNLYELGDEFVDPDTGEVLGRDERLVGTVQVIEAHNRFSKATATEQGQYIPNGAIARISESTGHTRSKPERKRKRRLF